MIIECLNPVFLVFIFPQLVKEMARIIFGSKVIINISDYRDGLAQDLIKTVKRVLQYAVFMNVKGAETVGTSLYGGYIIVYTIKINI